MSESVEGGSRRGRRHSATGVGAAVVLASTLAAVLALGGCAFGPTPQPDDSETDAPHGVSLLDVIGLWRVTEAPDAGPDVWLAVDHRWLTVWTPCMAVSGSWVSDGARMLATLSTGFGPCIGGSLGADSWVHTIRGVEAADDGGLRLVGEHGDIVARLTPASAPGPFDFGDGGTQEVTVPVVTDEARAEAAEPAALDRGLTPIDDDSLLGRWVLVDYEGAGDPFATFDGKGGYTASDGCNRVGGPLLVNEGGRFRAAEYGAMTDIGCDNVDLPQWIADATRAGIDPETGELVLVDREGSELARLARSAE